MENRFVPIPAAAGFQLSNPSILDITSLNASLEVFNMAGVSGKGNLQNLTRNLNVLQFETYLKADNGTMADDEMSIGDEAVEAEIVEAHGVS